MLTPETRYRRVGVHSLGIARIPRVHSFIGADALVSFPLRPVDAYVGWGRKDNTRTVRTRARREGVPFLALEDGFVRSIGLGVDGTPPLSIVVDDLGIYYDATRTSRLERLLEGSPGEADPLADATLLRRATTCMARMRSEGISKYNHAPDLPLGPRTGRERVLVVDQTAGDLSLRLGLTRNNGFAEMLAHARDAHPDAEILVKTHPDVIAGKRAGHAADWTRDRRFTLIPQPANPMTLIQQVDRVYVMTSLMGFEALIAGKPVHCFGAPFYSGWGLTEDQVRVSRRTRRRSLEEVFAAAYLLYARYVDLESGDRCQLEDVLDLIGGQRALAKRDAGRIVAVGFSAWKRGFVSDFLNVPASRLSFVRDAASAEREGIAEDTRLLVWGAEPVVELEALARRYAVPLWRMEDGFLRSVGLGADLARPASLVVDTRGLYFDPTRPSDLEDILQARAFPPHLIARARALRERLVASRLSKYNVGSDEAVAVDAGARRVVLVVGQVEGDASIRLGANSISTNASLLEAARHAHPDDYVVYKPHPDVLSGNRSGAVSPAALALADEVNVTASLHACLSAAHVVHTITSLVGFEALLRGLEVHCHGTPFYAGWGLTYDAVPHPRRTRRLDVDQLVAGALVLYPRYVSLRTHRLTRPEVVVQQLEDARQHAETTMPTPGGRYIRQGFNFLRSRRHAP